jgi:hypothetical protein
MAASNVQNPGVRTHFKTPEGRYNLSREKTHQPGILHYNTGKVITQVLVCFQSINSHRNTPFSSSRSDPLASGVSEWMDSSLCIIDKDIYSALDEWIAVAERIIALASAWATRCQQPLQLTSLCLFCNLHNFKFLVAIFPIINFLSYLREFFCVE